MHISAVSISYQTCSNVRRCKISNIFIAVYLAEHVCDMHLQVFCYWPMQTGCCNEIERLWPPANEMVTRTTKKKVKMGCVEQSATPHAVAPH